MARRRDDKQIAKRRLQILLEQAEKAHVGPDADLAPRYATLARSLALRHQLGLPKTLCRSCGSLRLRTRLHRNRLVRTCLDCGRVRRRIL